MLCHNCYQMFCLPINAVSHEKFGKKHWKQCVCVTVFVFLWYFRLWVCNVVCMFSAGMQILASQRLKWRQSL